MKGIFRNFLITFTALLATSYILPGLVLSGGLRGLFIGAIAFMVSNLLLIPFIKILLLPLNLLTLGLFAWLSNVLSLYLLVNFVPFIKLLPYDFSGTTINGFIIPAMSLSTFQVAIIASLIIGVITHFFHWLSK